MALTTDLPVFNVYCSGYEFSQLTEEDQLVLASGQATETGFRRLLSATQLAELSPQGLAYAIEQIAEDSRDDGYASGCKQTERCMIGYY